MAVTRVQMDDRQITISPLGIHRFLSLSRGVSIPLASIVGVARDSTGFNDSRWLSAFKMGSVIPGFYVAGSFRPMLGPDRTTSFWLVRHPEKAIRIRLRDHRYSAVTVEVDDPDVWMARIQEVVNKENSR